MKPCFSTENTVSWLRTAFLAEKRSFLTDINVWIKEYNGFLGQNLVCSVHKNSYSLKNSVSRRLAIPLAIAGVRSKIDPRGKVTHGSFFHNGKVPPPCRNLTPKKKLRHFLFFIHDLFFILIEKVQNIFCIKQCHHCYEHIRWPQSEHYSMINNIQNSHSIQY